MRNTLSYARAKLVAPFRNLYASNSGVAAIEFAIIFPLFLMVFFATAELINFRLTDRRAKQAVDFAAEYISRDQDNIMVAGERHVAEDLWQIVNPSVFKRNASFGNDTQRGNYTRGFTAIEFDRTPANCVGVMCVFEPRPLWVWSVGDRTTPRKLRTCIQKVVSNNERLDETKIPIGVTGRSPVVIADFVYRYQPLINTGLLDLQDRHIISIRKSRSSTGLAHPQQEHHGWGNHC